jgi:hypothetical protein
MSFVYSSRLLYNSADGQRTQHEELFRTDIRDGMDGVPLLLDIGVMDVTTCSPMENTLVDICELFQYVLSSIYSHVFFYRACQRMSLLTPCFVVNVEFYNASQATGIYSGFIASESSNTGTSNASTGSNSSMSAPMPSGTMSAGSGGSGGGSSGSVATDQETFG